MRWVDAVVAEFTKYTNWPLRSAKLDDLRALFEAREARDACKLSYQIETSPSGTATAVTVSSAAAASGAKCDAPLMLGAGVSGAAAKQVMIPLVSGGSARVELTGQQWNAFTVVRPCSPPCLNGGVCNTTVGVCDCTGTNFAGADCSTAGELLLQRFASTHFRFRCAVCFKHHQPRRCHKL
jgi:hypothetical protein